MSRHYGAKEKLYTNPEKREKLTRIQASIPGEARHTLCLEDYVRLRSGKPRGSV